MKLFPKLTMAVSFLLIAAMGCLTLCFYWTERRRMRTEALLERQAVLHSLMHIARESFLTDDDLLLIKYTRWIPAWDPALISASVVNLEGDVLAHSDPERIGQALPLSELSQPGVLVLSEAIQAGQQPAGTASVVFSEKALEEAFKIRLRRLQRRLLGIAALSLAVGVGLCLQVAKSWSRPIGQLAAAAESIGQGHGTVHLGTLQHRRDELGALARSFERMAMRLRELDIMKEDFVSAVTHELRSPLGAIESYLNVVAAELPEGNPIAVWENYLERLRINTRRLGDFVNRLLDVSALERGRIELNQREISLTDLAHDVLDLFALKFKEKRLSWNLLHPAAPLPVRVDPEKIRQVLVNLVSNAIKFTPPGGSVQVILGETVPGKSVRVWVVDSGIGIADADQQKIFNKFEQVGSARSAVLGPKGTGLGLSISKALVELHGQALSVQSRPGQGSVFSFALPAAGGGF